MTEEGYADIERRVIDTDPRPVTSVPTLDAERRQRETVEALEQACRQEQGEESTRKCLIPLGCDCRF